MGALTARHGDVESGRKQLEEAIELWRELGDRDELASALDALGWPLIYDAGDDAGALEAFEQSLELRRELGDPAGETRALVGVCQVLVALGDVDRAEPMARNLLERAGDDPRTEHFGYHFLADCALIRGDTVEAERRYRQSLQAALPLGDVIETSFEVQGVAMAVAGNGDPQSGLRLAGSVEALWESFGIAISIPFWDALLERYLGPAREQLGAECRRRVGGRPRARVRRRGRARPRRLRLEQGRQDEPDASRLTAHHVPAPELLVRRVEDGDVDVRLPAVIRRDRPLEAESPGAVGENAPAPVRAVAVRPGLPEDDERARDGRAVGCHDSAQ